MIRTALLRAIRSLRRGASVVESVVFGQLLGPQQFSAFELHRENGVAGVGRGVGIVVSRGDVQNPESLIDRRARPDARAGRPVLLPSCGALACGFRRFRDGEGLPELLARAG